MAYYITDKQPDCEGWAVVNDEFDLKACSRLESSAKKLAVEMAMLRNEPYGGIWSGDVVPRQHDGNHDNGMNN